ncbi:hypothetical protein [Gordonia soli]|uniref:FO synthase n=1 Tax=Gordonia soli NBRC 108243 TaxID=1223545 RepID=M0QD08_9ACTN|nr:hypothetical protein [Gordonia soli]GAC66440.1 hypothetical protein GS4_02_01510 [Gordonia soli NBRC 108243]
MVLREWARDDLAPVADVRAALRRVAVDPSALTDDEWVALLGADGDELEELAALADAARRRSVSDPEALTFVVNRNMETASVVDATSPTVEDLAREAWHLGATEICIQGPLPVEADADGYLDLIRRIHGAAPGLHLHAFRPPEIVDAAARRGITVADFLTEARDAGLGSVPGTAAQVLDDEVRSALSGGMAPPVDDWVEVITTAHRSGLFSTATLLYGHVETPVHQVRHLRRLVEIQRSTKGFSELIVMPLLPQNAPPPVAGIAGATVSRRETRAVHAVARLMTVGAFDHLQVAWTKVEPDTVDMLLRGGADDLGGLLLDGLLRPDAGQEAGRELDLDEVGAIADRAGRTPRQRTTAYTAPPADRTLPLPRVRA